MSAPATPDFVATGSIGRLKRVRSSQRMRNVELILVLVASAINVASLVLVQWGVLGKIDAGPLAICGLLAVLVIAIHLFCHGKQWLKRSQKSIGDVFITLRKTITRQCRYRFVGRHPPLVGRNSSLGY